MKSRARYHLLMALARPCRARLVPSELVLRPGLQQREPARRTLLRAPVWSLLVRERVQRRQVPALPGLRLQAPRSRLASLP